MGGEAGPLGWSMILEIVKKSSRVLQICAKLYFKSKISNWTSKYDAKSPRSNFEIFDIFIHWVRAWEFPGITVKEYLPKNHQKYIFGSISLVQIKMFGWGSTLLGLDTRVGSKIKKFENFFQKFVFLSNSTGGKFSAKKFLA